ncbi:MAG: hypothetical protein ACLGIV_16130 [Actinomycetes bacterium]
MDRHHYWDLVECRWVAYRSPDPVTQLPEQRTEEPAPAEEPAG